MEINQSPRAAFHGQSSVDSFSELELSHVVNTSRPSLNTTAVKTGFKFTLLYASTYSIFQREILYFILYYIYLKTTVIGYFMIFNYNKYDQVMKYDASLDIKLTTLSKAVEISSTHIMCIFTFDS